MRRLIDGTLNNLIFPLLVASIIGLVIFYVTVQVNQATLANIIENHLRMPAHKESQQEVKEISKDVESIKQEIKGIVREQHQIIKNIEQKIELNSTIILNEVRSINKELDKMHKN